MATHEARRDDRDDRGGADGDAASPTDPVRADYAPGGADGRASTFATLKRTVTEFSEDNLSDWAAALTYYGLLALFPALIAFVGVIGFFADPGDGDRRNRGRPVVGLQLRRRLHARLERDL